MIRLTVHDQQVKQLISSLGKTAVRAAEQALDRTIFKIYAEEKKEIAKVFKSPVPYTKNSLKYEKTKNHNLQVSIWFLEPDRMEEHYLVPQVEGGERKEKGFERAIDHTKFIPSVHLQLDRYGNIKPQLIRQILSTLGRAERGEGWQANRTRKSAVRNQKDRDFVWLPQGAGKGKLPPGVYRRVITTSQITPKQKRFLNRQIKKGRMSAGTYQQTKGGSSIAKAKGLMPVMIVGRQRAKVTPRLRFYEIAHHVYDREFRRTFDSILFFLVGGK